MQFGENECEMGLAWETVKLGLRVGGAFGGRLTSADFFGLGAGVCAKLRASMVLPGDCEISQAGLECGWEFEGHL
jgi:hypothetical protein